MFSQRYYVLRFATACCLILVVHNKSTHSFVPVVHQPSDQSSYPTTTRLLMVSTMSSTSMPEVVGISGCDDTLWNSIPYGAQRDLERFCRLATDESYEFVQTKEFPISPLDLAKNRVDTMKDINRFVVRKNNRKKNENENDDADDADDASPVVPPFEDLAWNNGVKSWELNNLAEKEMALAKVKADKKAAIKLMREEEEAAKVEAAAKLAKEVKAEAEMTDGMENDDEDDAFQ